MDAFVFVAAGPKLIIYYLNDKTILQNNIDIIDNSFLIILHAFYTTKRSEIGNTLKKIFFYKSKHVSISIFEYPNYHAFR